VLKIIENGFCRQFPYICKHVLLPGNEEKLVSLLKIEKNKVSQIVQEIGVLYRFVYDSLLEKNFIFCSSLDQLCYPLKVCNKSTAYPEQISTFIRPNNEICNNLLFKRLNLHNTASEIAEIIVFNTFLEKNPETLHLGYIASAFMLIIVLFLLIKIICF